MRPLEVIIQLDRNDIYRGDVDIALGEFTLYRSLTFGVSAAMLSAMFSWLIFAHFNDFAEPLNAVVFGGFFGIVIIPLLLIVTIHISSRKAAESLLQNTATPKGPTRWVFSDNGIETDSLTSRSAIQWNTFNCVRETKRQYLLYPQDGIAYAIPKRCFQTETEIGRLRELVRRCVPTAMMQSSDL